MIKDRIYGVIAGLLAGSVFTGGIVFAKNGAEWIEAHYADIAIYVDGVKITPRDANGGIVEPFVSNGTTYLPVRAAAEAIGKQVRWDGQTKSVWIGDKPGEVDYLTDICPPYDGEKYEIYKSSEGKYITVAGDKYSDLFTLGDNGTYTGVRSRTALFNLNAQYDALSFEVGRVDDSPKRDTTLNVYLDGKLYDSYEIKAEALPQRINIDLNSALQMKFEIIGKGGKYAFLNATIE